MTRYNGHKNWNCWNVALWLNNESNAYDLVRSYKDARINQATAVHILMHDLNIYPTRNASGKITSYATTPDGGRYTLDAIRQYISSCYSD